LSSAHVAVVHIAPAGIPEADRLERPVAHRVFAAAGELFDRQAALEEGGVLLLEILELGLLCSQQRLAEGKELLFVHGAVDVVGVALVVAGGAEGHAQIDALAFHDRAGGIEEVAVGAAGEGAQLLRQRFTGERACGEHSDLAGAWQCGVLTALHCHQWVLLEGFGKGGAVAAAVHRQGAAGGHGVLISGADHQGSEAPQLLLQQSGGPVATECPEAVAAHQFGEFAAVVGRRAADRPHLHQAHWHADAGDLPGGFGASQAGTDHDDRDVLVQKPEVSGDCSPYRSGLEFRRGCA